MAGAIILREQFKTVVCWYKIEVYFIFFLNIPSINANTPTDIDSADAIPLFGRSILLAKSAMNTIPTIIKPRETRSHD